MPKVKLNPNARKWVDALRSGKYKQGDGKLKIEDNPEDVRHCCLGVLCEVAKQEGLAFRFSPESSYLPQSVAKWAGLKTTKANYRERGYNKSSEDGSLVYLNDSGISFADIADFIEEHAIELGVAQ